MTKKKETETTGATRKTSVVKKGSVARRVASSPEQSQDSGAPTSEQKSALLSALADALGIALFACKRAGVRYEDYLIWRRDDPEFARAADLVGERALDFVEGKAFEEIKKGNARLIQFYLQTKGRARGYAKEGFAKEEAPPQSPTTFLTEDEMDY